MIIIAVTTTFMPVSDYIDYVDDYNRTHRIAIGYKHIYTKNLNTNIIHRTSITDELMTLFMECRHSWNQDLCRQLTNKIVDSHIKNKINERKGN